MPALIDAFFARKRLSNSARSPAFTQKAHDFGVNLGDDGKRGNQGIQGGEGEQGEQGIQGEQGFQGEQGEQGDQGNQGSQGNQGAQGGQGSDGAQGSQGDQGAEGAQGPQGYQGDQGAQGSQGYQGDQGAQGNDGAAGSQGPQGPKGGDSIITNRHGTRAVGICEGTSGQWFDLVPAEAPLEPWLDEALAEYARFRSVCGKFDLIVGVPKHCVGWRMPFKSLDEKARAEELWREISDATLLQRFARN